MAITSIQADVDSITLTRCFVAASRREIAHNGFTIGAPVAYLSPAGEIVPRKVVAGLFVAYYRQPFSGFENWGLAAHNKLLTVATIELRKERFAEFKNTILAPNNKTQVASGGLDVPKFSMPLSWEELADIKLCVVAKRFLKPDQISMFNPHLGFPSPSGDVIYVPFDQFRREVEGQSVWSRFTRRL